MKKAFLVIDTQPEIALFFRDAIKQHWSKARVDHYNPDKQGWPEYVDWKHYTLVFISSHMGDDDGLEWLHVLQKYPDFPSCVVLGDKEAGPDFDVDARNAGAVSYLAKGLLTAGNIIATVNASLEPVATVKSAASEKRRAPSVQKTGLAIDGYEIKEKIAEGGMSSIFLCRREEDQQLAILKTISERAEQVVKLKAIERSDLEFEVISRIRHPNVVRLYDHGHINGLTYTTMEYFSTGDLKVRMQAGITQQQALSYLLQIADGLNAIHGSGIIHRDLKPANIMFRDDETLSILDFGIAKDITRKLDLTLPGMRLGTPSYMSPEQGNGGYKLDARSDLYSLGVMLYEMLTKKRPYRGKTADVIKAHLYDSIPKLPMNFYEMQGLIDNLMGKFPHDRIESAYDLIQYIKKNYRFEKTLNFEFNPDGDFLSLDKDDGIAKF